MSKGKLTRATVPMCPECGAELVQHFHHSIRLVAWCEHCRCAVYRASMHRGHYSPPDVAVVVKDLKHQLSQPPNDDGYLDVTIGFLTNIIDRLEGRHE